MQYTVKNYSLYNKHTVLGNVILPLNLSASVRGSDAHYHLKQPLRRNYSFGINSDSDWIGNRQKSKDNYMNKVRF